jgi:hypothetical protein
MAVDEQAPNWRHGGQAESGKRNQRGSCWDRAPRNIAEAHLYIISTTCVFDDGLVLGFILIDEGHELMSFSSGGAALAQLSAGGSADVVLLDWRMASHTIESSPSCALSNVAIEDDLGSGCSLGRPCASAHHCARHCADRCGA